MARTFDGSASNHLLASGLAYAIPTNATIVFRAKTSSSAELILLGRRTAASVGFAIGRQPAGSSVWLVLFGAGGTLNSDSSAWPADGAYHSVIITKSDTSWTFYVDSTTAKGTATGAIDNGSGTNLAIGGWVDGFDGNAIKNPFDGAAYDVALFPSVLDSTDRAAFLGGTAPSALSAAGTDHYWPLNNAAAGDESDSFGSATLTEVGTVGYEATGGGGGSSSGAAAHYYRQMQ